MGGAHLGGLPLQSCWSVSLGFVYVSYSQYIYPRIFYHAFVVTTLSGIGLSSPISPATTKKSTDFIDSPMSLLDHSASMANRPMYVAAEAVGDGAAAMPDG